MKEGERIVNYSDQVIKYCEVNGISIPEEFHCTDTHKFAIILESKILHPATFDYDKEIHRAIKELDAKNFEILNFKNCYKYRLGKDNKIIKGDSFEGFIQYYTFDT